MKKKKHTRAQDMLSPVPAAAAGHLTHYGEVMLSSSSSQYPYMDIVTCDLLSPCLAAFEHTYN
jgi:hypothetical protein